MWPSELIGFLYAMSCTEDGRKALRNVDETGIPHMRLRAVIAELKGGNGTASLRELVRLAAQEMGVAFDPQKATFDNVAAHVEKITAREKKEGPLRAEVRSLVSELYECTRNPGISWPCGRIEHLVKRVQEMQETLAK